MLFGAFKGTYQMFLSDKNTFSSVPKKGHRQTEKTTPQNNVSDQCLHCLLSGISIGNRMKKSTPDTILDFLEKLSLFIKTFGHVLGCGDGFFWESGSVNQCGTKGKVCGCKLNVKHRQRPALLS